MSGKSGILFEKDSHEEPSCSGVKELFLKFRFCSLLSSALLFLANNNLPNLLLLSPFIIVVFLGVGGVGSAFFAAGVVAVCVC